MFVLPFIFFIQTIIQTMSVKQKISLINFAIKPTIVPRSVNQQKYVDALNNKNISILIGLGPAGTGKTLFSCNSAVNGIRTGQYKKIILTRPVVSVEEEIGFLPGSFINKMEPWTRPIFDIFLDHFSKTNLDTMIKMGTIEISPLGYMRGRTFKDSFIIADEMQNSSPSQMKMITTRIGEGSKMVITGDLNQSDRCEKNGLVDLVERLRKTNIQEDRAIELLELTSEDIQRSPVVRQILDIYESKYTITPSTTDSKKTTDSNKNITDSHKPETPTKNITTTTPAPAAYRDTALTYGDAAMIPINHMKRTRK
jgi:phosphate starvation-inducible PhoH-like protein